MTTELQRAMARSEEARIQYKRAVLASLNGASTGDAIRRAIQSFQSANAELKRLTAEPRPPPGRKQQDDQEPLPVWGFMRRLLRAG
jgi:hypothetical protein